MCLCLSVITEVLDPIANTVSIGTVKSPRSVYSAICMVLKPDGNDFKNTELQPKSYRNRFMWSKSSDSCMDSIEQNEASIRKYFSVWFLLTTDQSKYDKIPFCFQYK